MSFCCNIFVNYGWGPLISCGYIDKQYLILVFRYIHLQGPTEAERKIEELTRQLEEQMEKQEEEGEYFGNSYFLQSPRDKLFYYGGVNMFYYGLVYFLLTYTERVFNC